MPSVQVLIPRIEDAHDGVRPTDLTNT